MTIKLYWSKRNRRRPWISSHPLSTPLISIVHYSKHVPMLTAFIAIVDLQLGRLTSDFKSAPRSAPGSDLIGFCLLLPQAHGLARNGFFADKVWICCPCPPRRRHPICMHTLLSVRPPFHCPNQILMLCVWCSRIYWWSYSSSELR
jgi:hypothetical protein